MMLSYAGVLAFVQEAFTIYKRLQCIVITNMTFPEGFQHYTITGTGIHRDLLIYGKKMISNCWKSILIKLKKSWNPGYQF